MVAVGGTVRPCNGAEIENGRVIRYRMPRKLLACMQVLEYDRSFLASRILFDRFNGNIIISGAFGLFLKAWSSPPAATTAPPWGRTWSWW